MRRWLPGLFVVITGLCLPGLSPSQEQKSDATSPPRVAVAVRDSLGRPIPTAVVRVEASTVQVSAPGFLPWSGTLPPQGKQALRVVLLRPATFRGRVTSKGSGLPVFSIHLNPESGPAAALPAKISVKDEFFEIGSVVPGLEKLKIDAEGFIPLEQSESIREGEVRWLNLELRPASRLVATLLDGKKNPVPGVEARVRLEGQDARFLEEAEIKRLSGILSASDKSGRLVLGPLAQGSRYRIILRIEGRPARSLLVAPSTPSVAREINLPAGGTLRLTLKDKDGHPIPASTARLDSDDAPDVDLLPESRPSGKDGILNLGPLPAGTYSVRLQPEGFRPRTVRGCAVRDGAVSDQGEVRFEPGLEISGTVKDDAGAPIAAAAIRARFYESGRRLTASRKSDREGKFRVAGLPPGPVEIQAEAKGYQTERKEDVSAGTAGLELELTREGSLAGRVLADETGLPVPAFNLELHQEQGESDRRWHRPRDFPTTFENPEGLFSLEGLLPGKYSLGVKARGFKPALMEGVEAGSGDSKPLEIRLETGLGIAGVVLTAEDRAPVSGATVSATDLLPVETDAEGKFQIEGLAGKTQIQVTHPLYLTARFAEVDPERTPRLEVLLRRGGAVEGTVYGENGEPIPGAEVQARLAEGERPVTTGPEGRYRMEGLPTGPLALSKVDVPGTYEGFESALVQVEAGAVTRHDFGTGTMLHGVVTYAGAPASNARLTLARIVSELPEGTRGSLGSLSVRCGEDGSYETRGLQPGTYGLIVEWEGRKVGKLATIPAGEPTWRMDIDIPDLWLSGEVMDSETHLPLQASVVASQIHGSQSAAYTSVMNDGEGSVEFSSNPQSSGQTDPQGHFRLPLLEPAKYRVVAIASGYQMGGAVEVEVRASRNDLVVELAPAIELSVKAVDAATGKALDLSCASVGWSGSRTTNCGGGAGRFSSLRPGAIVVAAEVANYAPGFQKLELTAEQKEVVIPMTPGGRLQLLLPAGMQTDEVAIWKSKFRVEDGTGTDLTALFTSLRPWLGAGGGSSGEEGTVLIPHAPPGRLKISLGGEGTGMEPKQAEVSIEEGGEAVADLR